MSKVGCIKFFFYKSKIDIIFKNRVIFSEKNQFAKFVICNFGKFFLYHNLLRSDNKFGEEKKCTFL